MPILETEINTAPSFTHSHVYVGTIGSTYSVTLTAEDSESDELTFRTVYLPAWLSRTETTDTSLTLTGIPEDGSEGVNFFSVKASDGELIKEEHYAILISDPSSNQSSVYSLYGKDITELHIHSTSSIPIGGTEQPYSSVEILFNLSGEATTISAEEFEIQTVENAPSSMEFGYTSVDQYNGLVSISGSLPANEIHSNTITLTKGSDKYEFDLLIIGAGLTTGQITSIMGETTFNSTSLSGKNIFVNNLENDIITLDESSSFNFTSLDLSAAVSFEVDLGTSIQPVTISDVVSQLRDIVGLSELSGAQKLAADVDGDGEVNISDVVSNLRVIVGLSPPPRAQLIDQEQAHEYTLQHFLMHDFQLVFPGDVDGRVIELL